MDYFKKATLTTPAVIMDARTKSALIKGTSLIDEWSYHQQILVDITQNLKGANYSDFNFHLKVFNMKAAKFLIEVFRIIKACKSPIVIHWLYDRDDEEMLEMGKDYSELLGIPFELSPN